MRRAISCEAWLAPLKVPFYLPSRGRRETVHGLYPLQPLELILSLIFAWWQGERFKLLLRQCTSIKSHVGQ